MGSCSTLKFEIEIAATLGNRSWAQFLCSSNFFFFCIHMLRFHDTFLILFGETSDKFLCIFIVGRINTYSGLWLLGN